MGSALVKGWLQAGDVELLVWDTYQPAVEKLLAVTSTMTMSGSGGPGPGRTEVVAAGSLEQLAAAVETIVLVVKPKDAKEAMESLGGLVGPEQTVVSAMAGLKLEWLRGALGPGPALLRVMPNLAVELGAGAVAVAVEEGTQEPVVERSLELFGRLGLAETMPEELFDVFTAIAGSSPAFLALAIEGLEDGAVAAGLGRTEARRVVRDAALKVAREGPGEDIPASAPQDERVVLAFRAAVTAAMERSRQMSET